MIGIGTSCPLCWERNCQCDVPVTRAEPTLRGRRNSREHFEKLVTEIMGCVVGDGTLEMDIHTDGRPYKNAHVQYMWTYYKNKR